MKKIIAVLFTVGIAVGLSSCFKKFDPASYQPAFTVSGFTSVAEIGSGSLVGYWAFDGSLIDSVSKTVGTKVNTGFTSGLKGQALQGAMNGYVLTPASNAIKNLQSFTITEWINTPPPSTGIITFFSLVNTTHFWGNIEMFFENGSSNSNGKLRVHVNQGGNDNTYSVDNLANLFNTWTNIAVTYDAPTSVISVYVNGSRVSSGPFSGVTGPLSFADVGNIVFGAPQFQTTPSQTSATTAQSWASFMTGKIDEVRVYNKALSATELQAMIVLQGKGK